MVFEPPEMMRGVASRSVPLRQSSISLTVWARIPWMIRPSVTAAAHRRRSRGAPACQASAVPSVSAP